MFAASEDADSVTLVAPPWGGARRILESSPLLGEGRGYLLGERLAVGGMGSVYFGLKTGALGFQRVVAIKRLHEHLVQSPDSVTRFKNEIRLVSRLSHPNLIETFDVIAAEGELILVMEYVDGETLHALLEDANSDGLKLSPAVVAGILSQALHGLHAAHEATDDEGNSLDLVHRDVSPQNIMIDKDGIVKVLDFGIAKAASELQVTRTGELSGKVAYMSPEQASARTLDRRSDVFAAGVILWEGLTGERLFRPHGTPEGAALLRVLEMRIPPPTRLCAARNPVLDRIVLRALERDPARRFGSARDLALALEDAFPSATASTVASALAAISGARMLRRAERLRAFLAEHRRSSVVGAPHAAEDAPSLSVAERGGTGPRAHAVSGPTRDTGTPDEGVSLSCDDPELQTRELAGVLVAQGAATLRSRRRAAWLTLGMIAAATLAWCGARLVPASSPPNTGSPSPQPSPASMSAAQLESAPLKRSPSTAQPSPGPLTQTPEAAPSPPPRASASASSRSKRSRRPSSSRTEPPTARTQCSSPTYTDADGIRHFKPECL